MFCSSNTRISACWRKLYTTVQNFHSHQKVDLKRPEFSYLDNGNIITDKMFDDGWTNDILKKNHHHRCHHNDLQQQHQHHHHHYNL